MRGQSLAGDRRRQRVARLGVAVAVLGGIGPFFGSYEFIREERSHADPEPARTNPEPAHAGESPQR